MEGFVELMGVNEVNGLCDRSGGCKVQADEVAEGGVGRTRSVGERRRGSVSVEGGLGRAALSHPIVSA